MVAEANDLLTALATVGTGLAAGLLVLAGVIKLRAPGDAALALGLRRGPWRAWLAGGLGAVEVLLGALGLLVGGPVGFLTLAAGQIGLLGAAASRRRRGQSCGCFGTASRVGGAHLVVLAVGALAAVSAAVRSAPTAVGLVTADPWPGVLLLLRLGAGVALVRVVMTSAVALRDAVVLVEGSS